MVPEDDARREETMKALVVYESMFGNTAEIGEAIAESLRGHGMQVESGAIVQIEPSRLAEVDLIVVGAPTHAHGMSRTGTRKAAVNDRRYPASRPADPGPGIRDWLETVPPGRGRLAAAFDTRFDKSMWLTGSAAKGIAQRLEKAGFRAVSPPESFFVTNEHRLEPGQLERAAAWGAALADRTAAGITG
jgi:flavodoxin